MCYVLDGYIRNGLRRDLASEDLRDGFSHYLFYGAETQN
jgi:hypothetical protein